MTSVLCARLSAMGDLVHCLGAIAALHRARPDWRIVLVTQREFVDLVRDVSGIARVVPFDRHGGPGAMWRVRRELRRECFDHALDLQGNWKSAAILRLSAARERIGADAPWRREPASGWLLGRRVAIPERPHPAVVAHALVRELAPEAEFEAPRLVAEAAEVERAADSLRQVGIDPERPFRVIVVSDPDDPRALRPSVVDAETESSELPVVHLFGPAEAGVPERGAPSIRHTRGEVRQLVALGELIARAGGEVLGPDQGASHVLAAAGARCRIWFGAQDPRRTAPVGAQALVHPDPPSCVPCRSSRCRHPAGPVCMDFRAETGREVPFEAPADPRRT